MFNMNAPLASALRHVYTAVSVIAGTLTVVGLSQGDATAIGEAVKQIGEGVAGVVAGVSTLIPIAMSAWAAWSATRKTRMTEMNTDPQIEQIRTRPGSDASKEAQTIPGNKVS